MLMEMHPVLMSIRKSVSCDTRGQEVHFLSIILKVQVRNFHPTADITKLSCIQSKVQVIVLMAVA